MLGCNFTKRTIVVTALTGVAATIIKGETIHTAAHLNRIKRMEEEQIEEWKDVTRFPVSWKSTIDRVVIRIESS